MAERIAPGAGPVEAAAALDAVGQAVRLVVEQDLADHRPADQVVGLGGPAWMQDLTDRAVADLGGT